MRVTNLREEHLIVLSSQEATALVDVCTMVLLASRSAPGAKLPANVTRVLADVFESLSAPIAGRGALQQSDRTFPPDPG